MTTDFTEKARRLRNAVEPVAAGVSFAPEALAGASHRTALANDLPDRIHVRSDAVLMDRPHDRHQLGEVCENRAEGRSRQTTRTISEPGYADAADTLPQELLDLLAR